MNYTEMTDSELDKLSVEMLGGKKLSSPADYYSTTEFWYRVHHNLKRGDWCTFGFNSNSKIWNPTHPNSNQAERYLFPKFIEKGIRVKIDFRVIGPSGAYFISLFHEDEDNETLDGPPDMTPFPEQINRTKVIACLEAWEKLNNG